MQLPQSFDPRLAIQQAGTERLVARPQPELLQRDWSCSHALALAGSRRLGPQKWRQGLEQLVSLDLRRASVGSSTRNWICSLALALAASRHVAQQRASQHQGFFKQSTDRTAISILVKTGAVSMLTLAKT